MTIQYVDASGATQSLTVEFFDTDSGGTSTGTATVDVGLDYSSPKSAENIRDAFVAASFPAGSITVANGSGTDDADITLATLGTIGDTKTVTSTFTTSATFGGGTDATPITGTLAAILYMSASNIRLSGTGREENNY